MFPYPLPIRQSKVQSRLSGCGESEPQLQSSLVILVVFQMLGQDRDKVMDVLEG